MELGNFNSVTSLSQSGIVGLNSIHYNLNEAALMQQAVIRKEGVLGLGGSLLVKTGKHTGRSPKDKYVVTTEDTLDSIWWEQNKKLTPKNFDLLYADLLNHMKGKDYFVQDLYACADPDFRINVR